MYPPCVARFGKVLFPLWTKVGGRKLASENMTLEFFYLQYLHYFNFLVYGVSSLNSISYFGFVKSSKSFINICRGIGNTVLEWSIFLTNQGSRVLLRKFSCEYNVQCLNLAPMKKAWFMASKKYSPNGKGIMASMEYTPMVYSP